MFPTAYDTEIYRNPSQSIELIMQSDEGKRQLNMRNISFRFLLHNPYAVDITIHKQEHNKSSICDTLKTRFIAKDPENYEKLVDDTGMYMSISTADHEVTENEARKLIDDFFSSLFAPNMRESLLPLYPKDLKILQETLLMKNYRMQTVVTTPWTPNLFAHGSVAQEALDAKQTKEQGCTWSI